MKDKEKAKYDEGTKMFTLKGFQLSEKVSESKRSLIYRGVRESDKLPGKRTTI